MAAHRTATPLADGARWRQVAIWVGAGSDWDGEVVGQSGGLPRLRAGAEWPSHGGDPLPFVASLDCAALPKIEKLPLAGPAP
ncbi:DUF1963 domain-containing protein, partial [Micromonospora sp. STR1s_5]|nr:DUF1963 domain-containing protein [Micromonospora sp. STR1s_5]